MRARRYATSHSIHALESRLLLAGGVDRLINNNIGSSGTSFFTQTGSTIVAAGNNVAIAFNDSGSNGAGANKFTGFAYSTNGGASFTDGGTLPNNANGDAGFPVLARNDTTGRIYLSTLRFSGAGVNMFRSDDNGATWQAPVNAMPGLTGFQDRGWVQVDNFPGAGNGNVYVASRDFGAINGIMFFRSVDHGSTFTPGGGVLLAAGGAQPSVVVAPDHSVCVFWLAGTTIQMRRSVDLGLTFAAPVTVATGLSGVSNGDMGLTGIRQGTVTPAAFRSNGWPQAAVNPVTGHLYVVFARDVAGADKADVFLVQSTTSGASWGAQVRVNDDATTTDQWGPTLAVTPNGAQLGIFYYSRQEDPANNNLFRYYGRVANISGATLTFTASSAISDVASLPEFGRDGVVNAVYLNDYDTAYATNGAFHVTWADMRSDLSGGAPRKDPNVYYDTIALAPSITASEFRFETAAQNLAFTLDQDVSASAGLGDVLVVKLPAGPTVAPSTFGYSALTNTMTFSFSGILPDGDYLAIVQGADVASAFGLPMSSDHVLPFFFLNGDASRDRTVDTIDFGILALNFAQSGKTFSQGNFDYDPAGVVSTVDFGLLAANFGKTLAAVDSQSSAAVPAARLGVRESWLLTDPDDEHSAVFSDEAVATVL